MIIMQTVDANARKAYIERNKLAKVILCHELEKSVCIQYHPKGIKGGVIPELDSHHHSDSHPDPLAEPFSPWHAVGPPETYPIYSAGMKRHGNLQLLSTTLRLAPGDHDTLTAAKQWEHIFGIQRGKKDGEIEFTNAKLSFLPGEQGKGEGITEIVIGVDGRERLDGIHRRASQAALTIDNEGRLHMLGVKWSFLWLGDSGESRCRL